MLRCGSPPDRRVRTHDPRAARYEIFSSIAFIVRRCLLLQSGGPGVAAPRRWRRRWKSGLARGVIVEQRGVHARPVPFSPAGARGGNRPTRWPPWACMPSFNSRHRVCVFLHIMPVWLCVRAHTSELPTRCCLPESGRIYTGPDRSIDHSRQRSRPTASRRRIRFIDQDLKNHSTCLLKWVPISLRDVITSRQ